MLSKLKKHDDVEITLRDKSTAQDHVVGIDRDGTVNFKKLGYRYRSGMEFHDHPSKKDIVEIKVIGASSEEDAPKVPELVSDDELVKECNRLTSENAKLKEKIAKLQETLKSKQQKKAPKATVKAVADNNTTTDEGKADENTTTGETGNSEDTETAESK